MKESPTYNQSAAKAYREEYERDRRLLSLMITDKDILLRPKQKGDLQQPGTYSLTKAEENAVIITVSQSILGTVGDGPAKEHEYKLTLIGDGYLILQSTDPDFSQLTAYTAWVR